MIEYITNRELVENGKKGKIRILKLKEESSAKVVLLCPNCQKEDEFEVEWKEPFVRGKGINQVFNIECRNCGFRIKLRKLRKEVKKRKR